MSAAVDPEAASRGDPGAGGDEDASLTAATLLFVLSGAAALVYQVAWQRLLALSTGVGVYSIAIITASFMAGLGLGSHMGGVASARLRRRSALRAFGVIELAVAAFACASVPLYYRWLQGHASVLYDGLGRATATHFLTLLPPTALMGMSLPFLVRGLVRDRAEAPHTIGVLYAANALGAAVGAALTPWLLFRFLGVQGAILVGAAGSALAGLGALGLSRRASEAEASFAPAAPSAPVASGEERHPLRLWIALYAISGLVSLSLEMVWFRVLEVTGKGAAFTFGTLLAVYLSGLALGTFVAARLAPRARRPLVTFLTCQCGIVGTTLLAHGLLVWLPGDWPGLSWLLAYGHRQYGVKMVPFESGAFLVIYALLPALLFGPSTFLMGFGFPILQRAVQSDPVLSGRRVGVLQAANIAGCVLGSLATGLFFFDRVGSSGVFKSLAVVGALVALVGLRTDRRPRFAALALALLALAVAFPDNARLWKRLHGEPPAADSFVEENAASVTALTPEGSDGRYRLWINGRHNSWLPYGWLHTVIGALPALAHPLPRTVAVVGLGSGDTAWAAGCREETRGVVVFEIASSQLRLVSRVADQPAMVRLKQFLTDPRVTIVPDDGRRRLRADQRRYDIIVADSIDYDTSLVTHLHSVEYFELVRDTLNRGGLICALAKTPRLRGVIRSVFPHVVVLREDLLLASAQPIELDKGLWLSRARSARTIDYLGKARMREIVGFIERASLEAPAPPEADLIHDLEPKDEFFRPLAFGNGGLGVGAASGP